MDLFKVLKRLDRDRLLIVDYVVNQELTKRGINKQEWRVKEANGQFTVLSGENRK